MKNFLTYILSILTVVILANCSSNAGSSSPALQGTVLVGGTFGFASPAITAISNESGTWTSITNNTESGTVLFDVNGSANQIVAVGGNFMSANPVILTSSNGGESWVIQTTPATPAFLTGITYGNGIYVASGGDLTSASNLATILRSTDGIIWSPASNFVSNPGDILYRGVYAKEKFVVVGSNNANAVPKPIIQTSTDGNNWESQVTDVESATLYGVTYGHDKYVAVGAGILDGSTILPIVMTSTNGITWNTSSIESATVGTSLLSIVYAKNKFVAVGGGQYIPGGPALILTSNDAINWTLQNNNVESGVVLDKIQYVNNQYIAVGANTLTNHSVVITSTDGITWNIENTGLESGSILSVAGYNK